jgi:hypothetical protein
MPDAKQKKPKYQPPVLMPLGEMSTGSGQCANGSGAAGHCDPVGNSPEAQCKAGVIGARQCMNGTAAVRHCKVGHAARRECQCGNSPVDVEESESCIIGM